MTAGFGSTHNYLSVVHDGRNSRGGGGGFGGADTISADEYLARKMPVAFALLDSAVVNRVRAWALRAADAERCPPGYAKTHLTDAEIARALYAAYQRAGPAAASVAADDASERRAGLDRYTQTWVQRLVEETEQRLRSQMQVSAGRARVWANVRQGPLPDAHVDARVGPCWASHAERAPGVESARLAAGATRTAVRRCGSAAAMDHHH
jgi:hypothetical protein